MICITVCWLDLIFSHFTALSCWKCSAGV